MSRGAKKCLVKPPNSSETMIISISKVSLLSLSFPLATTRGPRGACRAKKHNENYTIEEGPCVKSSSRPVKALLHPPRRPRSSGRSESVEHN